MATHSFAHHANRAADAAFNSYSASATDLVGALGSLALALVRHMSLVAMMFLACLGMHTLLFPHNVVALRASMLEVATALYDWLSRTVYRAKQNYLRMAYTVDANYAAQQLAKEMDAAAAAKAKHDAHVAEWQAAKARCDAELAKLAVCVPVPMSAVAATDALMSPAAAAAANLVATPREGDQIIIAEGPLDADRVAQMAAAMRKNASYTVADAQRAGLQVPLAPHAHGQDPQPLLTAALGGSGHNSAH